MRPVRFGNISIHCGDMLEILPSLQDIKCICTDPPYGLGKKMQGGTWGQGELIKNMHVWDEEANQQWFDTIYDLNVPTVFWGGNYYIVPPTQCWLMWRKPGMPTMADFEMAWTNIERPSKVFPHNRSGWEKHHATQKPIKLIKWCIEYTRTEGTICDPFAGSGVAGIVALQLKRKCVLIEKDPVAFDKICTFIEDAVASTGQIKKQNPVGILY